MWTPGNLVGMSLNGPRISDGISGFTSQVSMCDGPPVIHSRITALLEDAGPPPTQPQQFRKSKPRQPRNARLQHTPPAENSNSLPPPPVQKRKRVSMRMQFRW